MRLINDKWLQCNMLLTTTIRGEAEVKNIIHPIDDDMIGAIFAGEKVYDNTNSIWESADTQEEDDEYVDNQEDEEPPYHYYVETGLINIDNIAAIKPRGSIIKVMTNDCGEISVMCSMSDILDIVERKGDNEKK